MYANPASKPSRIRLRDVRLDGGLATFNKVLFGLTLLAVALMAGTYFMNWHAYHGDALFSGGVIGPFQEYHTGYYHSGGAPLVVLGVIGAMSAIGLWRPRFGLGLGASITNFVMWLPLVVLLFNLDHLFDHIVTLAPAIVFGSALFLLLIVAITNVAMQPVLFVLQRRRMRRRAQNEAYATSGAEYALNARIDV